MSSDATRENEIFENARENWNYGRFTVSNSRSKFHTVSSHSSNVICECPDSLLVCLFNNLWYWVLFFYFSISFFYYLALTLAHFLSLPGTSGMVVSEGLDRETIYKIICAAFHFFVVLLTLCFRRWRRRSTRINIPAIIDPMSLSPCEMARHNHRFELLFDLLSYIDYNHLCCFPISFYLALLTSSFRRWRWRSKRANTPAIIDSMSKPPCGNGTAYYSVCNLSRFPKFS